MRKIVLLALVSLVLVGCASKEERIDVCEDMTALYIGESLEQTAENLSYFQNLCAKTALLYPDESRPLIATGRLFLHEGRHGEACILFGKAAALGDPEQYLIHCDGTWKAK